MKPEKPATTHNSFSFLLLSAQIFGLLPVTGVSNADPTCLDFQWRSKRTIYSIVFAICSSGNVVFQVLKMVKSEGGVVFGDFVTLLFYVATAATVILFLEIGRKWRFLMGVWSEVDGAFRIYGGVPELGRRLKLIAFLVLFGAFVEHSLFLSFAFKNTAPGATAVDTLNNYFSGRFSDFFGLVSYNIIWGICLQVLNIFSTISWNFMDLFIILISEAMTVRFRQITKSVRYFAKKKVQEERLWRITRENYTKLTILCAVIDEILSNLMLLSFGNNIFVILVQLFNTLQRPPNEMLLDKIYYSYSFGFLITRIIMVALFAARINTESRKPGFYLNILHHSVYNCEIAGAIVTYELVLIQFMIR